MRKAVVVSLLILSLYIEVILLHFPLFLILSIISLLFFREIFMLMVVFLLSLILDSLMVNLFGITAIFIFGVMLLASMRVREVDLRSRVAVFFFLILVSVFYSMMVGYSHNFLIYLLIFLGYGVFEYLYRDEKLIGKKIIPWV